METHFDVIVVGSGFGGSVAALRLAEKGYRVLVLEKGKRWAKEDFPKTNWDLRRWMWMPMAGMKGIFQMSFFQHVSILHGVGVGGGSLVYANTLPTPKDPFFRSPSWAHLADWKAELEPHYRTARRMLGAVPNPCVTVGDTILGEVARDIGREKDFQPTEVGVFFGKPGEKVKDPYFGGDGPDRVGCTYCGACMTGCRVGAKNTLDQNYLYLAEKRGVTILPEQEVTAIRSLPGGGYRVESKPSLSGGAPTARTADRVVLAGGVLGTVPLLLKMKEDPQGLPRLSPRVGDCVRTNSEALIAVVAPESPHDFSKGVAITSILHTDEQSHLEPVRYGAGSSFFRTMIFPHSPGPTLFSRLTGAARNVLKHPKEWSYVFSVTDMSVKAQILLYMRSIDGTLAFRLGRSPWTGFREGLVSRLDDPTQAPKAFMKEATDLAERFAKKVGGVTVTLFTETLLGTPSTAHILGGCCMGTTAETGVIDAKHEVFGYPGLYVVDGSAVSANPGVNPSLTITAMAERAMGLVPAKETGAARA